jgi:hypothetical protein
LEKSLAAAAEPFKGITINGTVIPGLFGIQKTGVSTQAICEAARLFSTRSAPSNAPNPFSRRHRSVAQVEQYSSDAHAHGTPLFEMNDHQRDCAFTLMRESLSQNGFEEALNVMHLNETVLEMTGRLSEYGEDLYWLSIMGKPSSTEAVGVGSGTVITLIINYFVLGDQSW